MGVVLCAHMFGEGSHTRVSRCRYWIELGTTMICEGGNHQSSISSERLSKSAKQQLRTLVPATQAPQRDVSQYVITLFEANFFQGCDDIGYCKRQGSIHKGELIRHE